MITGNAHADLVLLFPGVAEAYAVAVFVFTIIAVVVAVLFAGRVFRTLRRIYDGRRANPNEGTSEEDGDGD